MGHFIVRSDDGTVTIDESYYDELTDDSLLLSCLRNNGVDNWDWWGKAINEYNELKGEDNE